MTFLRVMTFNVQGYEDEADQTNWWVHRSELNVKTIQRYRPDVIGIQEITQRHMLVYDTALADYEHTALPAQAEYEASPIFWKRDKFELLDTGVIWLSPTPDVPFSKGWGIDEYALSAVWVKLKSIEDGTIFIHLNTQFEDGPWGAQFRLESSKLLVRRLAQLQDGGLPAIATGDFNCEPWDAPYTTFMANGFADTWRAAGHGDSDETSTFHGFQGKKYFGLEWGGSVFWRVDWILARAGNTPNAVRVETASCTIVRDAEPPLYPSDHYPVVAELELFSPDGWVVEDE